MNWKELFRRKEIPMDPPDEPTGPQIIKRSGILFLLAVVLFGALLLRVFLLETVGYDRYRQKVIDQLTTESVVRASRGNLYDANGAVLATNITTYRVFIAPHSIAAAQSKADQNGEAVDLVELLADRLSSILRISPDLIRTEAAKTAYLDRTLARGVSEETADRVRALIAEYGLQTMVYLEAVQTRYYPYGSLAAQTIGFTGSDGSGLYGLEYSYNDELAGSNGRYITARDARGNEMPYEYEEYVEASDGYSIHTTLDVYVQAALDEQLQTAYTESKGQNRAAGIVMDVQTGAVLAMSTYPNFDLNHPWDLDEQSLTKLRQSGLASDSDEYAAKRQELLLKMWSNKAITESYIPGSTFKVITAAMALEEDVVELDDTFNCPGYKEVLGYKIHCHKTQGHGMLTFVQGIQQSCNPVLMSVGHEIGKERFYEYLSAFGYRSKTGIDLPGEGSSVVIAEESFTELDLAIYSFGQNFNVTLLQQITAISAVANGGNLVTPYLVSSVTDSNGNTVWKHDVQTRRQVVSKEVCETVAQILEEGVSGDGGAKNAYVMGYRVAAKTGTSEKKNVGSTGRYVCSTVAFAPADHPQYAVIIIVDEPTAGTLYGSVVAAPYVGNVMETILPYLGVEAVYSEQELEHMTVSTPNCVGWATSYAESYCKRNGLTCEIYGDGNVINRQCPQAGTVMEKSSGKMIFYAGKEAEAETVIVPNVVGNGMTALAANKALVNAGLNIRIRGTKNYLTGTGEDVVPISQSVAPGTRVPKGTVVEVVFRSLTDADFDRDLESDLLILNP